MTQAEWYTGYTLLLFSNAIPQNSPREFARRKLLSSSESRTLLKTPIPVTSES